MLLIRRPGSNNPIPIPRLRRPSDPESTVALPAA